MEICQGVTKTLKFPEEVYRFGKPRFNSLFAVQKFSSFIILILSHLPEHIQIPKDIIIHLTHLFYEFESDNDFSLEKDYSLIKVIGRGEHGKVLLVESKRKDKQQYAIKMINKSE